MASIIYTKWYNIAGGASRAIQIIVTLAICRRRPIFLLPYLFDEEQVGDGEVRSAGALEPPAKRARRTAQAQRSRCRSPAAAVALLWPLPGAGVVVDAVGTYSSSLSSSVATRRRRDERRQRPKERKRETEVRHERGIRERKRESERAGVPTQEGRTKAKTLVGAARSAKPEATERGGDRNSLTSAARVARDVTVLRAELGSLSITASSVPVYFPLSQLSGEHGKRRAKK